MSRAQRAAAIFMTIAFQAAARTTGKEPSVEHPTFYRTTHVNGLSMFYRESLATTRTRHVGNDPNVERYDPDLWTDEFAFLNQPGQADIQSDLFYDYRTNVDAYPNWQAWMRKRQPRLLVIWGKYDLSFEPSEPHAYQRDVPSAEVHVLEAGHFALDTAAEEIAALVRGFLGSLPTTPVKKSEVLQ